MAKSDKTHKPQSGKALVIVESPTKATTLRKYLGDGFLVEASVGHIRDLVTKKTELGAGDPRRDQPWVHYGVNVDNGFEPLEEIYLVPPEKKRQIDTLKHALAEADRLYLATDDDREGEAISWHLLEVLKPKVPAERLVFHEITKEAVAQALTHTRKLDQDLVVAQRTRRVVDRLFGWDVSEVLWRKIKPGLSAGRVQSVALRLLVQRERERMAFVSSTYWDLIAKFVTRQHHETFEANLARVGGKRVASGKDFDDTTGKLTAKDAVVLDQAAARALAGRLAGQPGRVEKVEIKPQVLRPYPPFTTSTLQQEGSRKLRFTARQTMQVAQKLYESGFITYMRTDSTTLSEQALTAARGLIRDQYGADYLPAQPRRYQTKSANAQEAHEAIRPAGTQFPSMTEVEHAMGRDASRLYELIWKRTVASQMVDAQVEQTTVDVAVDDALFRSSGRTTRFAGFLKAYVEGSDDPDQMLSDRDRTLPILKAGDALEWGEPPLEPKGHETKPPARLTDASLVKALEDKGIGRPSTYAAILQNLLDKAYCFRRGSSALVPTFMGMAVIQMLETYMPHLVDYNFTAEMEARLDAIARGEVKCAAYLRGFYEDGFPAINAHGPVQGLCGLLSGVRDRIDPVTASSVFIGKIQPDEAVNVRIGRFGTFVKAGERTANVPDDTAPDELTVAAALELIEKKARGEAPLGQDPQSGEPIFLRNGRFGWYLQRGAAGKAEGAPKPQMVSLSKGMKPEEVNIDKALLQLTLPRTLGKSPKSGQAVLATVGRYGDYIKCGEDTRTLPPGQWATSVTLEEALALLARPRSVAGKEHVRDIGARSRDGAMLSLWTGRYGLYVTDGKVNKTLSDKHDPDTLTVELADALLAEAKQAREGKLMGADPATGAEVRLLDGRFGPYLTDGKTNASLARGTSKDDLTLEEALDRLKHFGKPVKKKAGARGAARKAAAPAKAAKTSLAKPGVATAKKASAKKAVAAKKAPTTAAPVQAATATAAAPRPVVRRRPAAGV